MNKIRNLILGCSIIGGANFLSAAEPNQAVDFVKAHCLKCHGPTKQEGDVRLDDLPAEISRDLPRWRLVTEQIRGGLMPPEGEPRIDAKKLATVTEWLIRQTAEQPRLPNQGNLVSHDALFGKPAAAEPASPGRVWRLSPEGYKGFVADVHRGRDDGVIQPFTMIPERGIKDFAQLYSIDEASTEVLLRNAQVIVDAQTAHKLVDGIPKGQGDTIGEFVKLMSPTLEPTRAQIEAAIQLQMKMALGRKVADDEVARFYALYEKCAADGDRPAALKTVLQAVLLRAQAMYRAELGKAAESSKRKMLDPLDLARAISITLTDRRENLIMQAAEKGLLNSKEEVAAHVERILNDPKLKKPGLLRFFREYFEYHQAPDVFKDKPKDKIKHVPTILVNDTDRLVQYILDQDKDVLRELLTTEISFVNYNTKVDKSKPNRPTIGVPADVVPKPDLTSKNKPEWHWGVDYVYGFEEWPAEQPTKLPEGQRIGILMQPSWLVAWSTNFDNDVVRRGRWIRERLLGGTVPDLPIGVVAQVPEERHRTYRDRLTVTRDAKCWKCHQQMDDLGLPFENFDHYGRYRTTETVIDLEATEKNVDKKGKPLGTITKEAPLDTTGLVARSGDQKLDGPVTGPQEMLRRLADSSYVRQVFIRHVFRFYLGRNETVADARTLQEADRAYVESGGSFKALVVSLLSSDSFLYRTDAVPQQPNTASVGATR